MKKFLRDLFDWLVLPLAFVVAVHLAIWVVISFIAWDVLFLRPAAHRFLFSALCLLTWGNLIDDALSEDKEEGKQ